VSSTKRDATTAAVRGVLHGAVQGEREGLDTQGIAHMPCSGSPGRSTELAHRKAKAKGKATNYERYEAEPLGSTYNLQLHLAADKTSYDATRQVQHRAQKRKSKCKETAVT
jgi:hypothetical protein